jgi:hypothetical protein
MPPRWYPYFEVVMRIVWSDDPESYIGGDVATGTFWMPGRSNVMM